MDTIRRRMMMTSGEKACIASTTDWTPSHIILARFTTNLSSTRLGKLLRKKAQRLYSVCVSHFWDNVLSLIVLQKMELVRISCVELLRLVPCPCMTSECRFAIYITYKLIRPRFQALAWGRVYKAGSG